MLFLILVNVKNNKLFTIKKLDRSILAVFLEL